MELDLMWILVGLPLAFGLGWVASRLDLRQLRIDNRQAPRAYFKGLNYLLNDSKTRRLRLIKAVQNDPDTSELHFALEICSADAATTNVRCGARSFDAARRPENRRPPARSARVGAGLFEAGLLDRAEDALRKSKALLFKVRPVGRLAIYERSREWPQASQVAQLLEDSGEANFAVRQAHYLCEQARERHDQSDMKAAQALLNQALQIAPQAGRSRILLGQLQLSLAQPELALQTLQPLFENKALSAPLAAATLARAALAAGHTSQALALLQTHYSSPLPICDGGLGHPGGSVSCTAPHARTRYTDH